MSEFSNRIKAQRSILKIVNSNFKSNEELCGLSLPAIERWLSVHRIDPSSKIAIGLVSAASRLFFLANKSQEQITEEYKAMVDGFEIIAQELRVELELMVKSS